MKKAIVGTAALFLATAAIAEEFALTYDPFRKIGREQISPADPEDEEQVRLGATLYVEHCAACHGAALEGAENWQEATEDGMYLPPPHDDTGHTWHHSDKVLFEYTKLGGEALFADFPDIVSGMPGFGDRLTDAEIWSILAFIKASWSDEHRRAQTTASEYDPLPDAYSTDPGLPETDPSPD